MHPNLLLYGLEFLWPRPCGQADHAQLDRHDGLHRCCSSAHTENRPHRVAACHRASCQGAERAFHRFCVGWLGRDNGASLVFLRSHGAAHPSESVMSVTIVHRVPITRHVTTYGSVHYTYGQRDSAEAAEPGVLHLFFVVQCGILAAWTLWAGPSTC